MSNFPEEPTAENPPPAPADDVISPPNQSGDREDEPVGSEEAAEEVKKDEAARGKSSGKTKGKKVGKDSKKSNKAPVGGDINQEQKEVNLRCVICHFEFSTRNKLFDHLKMTGHATALSSAAMTTNNKKEKRKNR